MSRDELHKHASSTTPAVVNVPNTWAGLIVWAVGKWGVGTIFMIMLGWVYLDLQEANRAMVEVVRANAVVIENLAKEVRSNGDKVDRLDNSLHFTPNRKNQ